MQPSDFWALVEQARADCLEREQWPTGGQIGQALTPRLAQLPPDQIVAFEHCLSAAVRQADTWEICAACFLISGYLSDDGFNDFKAGLVGLGNDAFDRVTAAPDSLADLPIVKAIAAGVAGPFTLHGESVYYAAATAYASRTGEQKTFWKALKNQAADAGWPDRKSDEWSGRFGPEDAPAIPARLPRLYALFPRDLAAEA